MKKANLGSRDAFVHWKKRNKSATASQVEAVRVFVQTIKDAGFWNQAVAISVFVGTTIEDGTLYLKYPNGFRRPRNNGALRFLDSAMVSSDGITNTSGTRRLSTGIVPARHGITKDNFSLFTAVTNDINTTNSLVVSDNVNPSAAQGAIIYNSKGAQGLNSGGQQSVFPQNQGKPYTLCMSSNGIIKHYLNFTRQFQPVAVANVRLNNEIVLFHNFSFGASQPAAVSFGLFWIGYYITEEQNTILVRAVRTLLSSLGMSPATKECVFEGDSKTFGTGASVPNNRWSTLTAARFGLKEANCGIGGSPFNIDTTIPGGFANRANYYNYNCYSGGKVVIMYGTNDCRVDTGSGTPATLTAMTTNLAIHLDEWIARGMTPADIYVFNIPLLTEAGTTTARMDAYTAAIAAACVGKGVHYYDPRPGMLSTPAGVVTITNGSPTLTGAGTSFLTDVAAGDQIRVNTLWYIVQSVTNNTTLTFTTNYTETTVGVGAPYSLTKYMASDKIHHNDAGHAYLDSCIPLFSIV